MAAFARRSACALCARPTCSNVTRPISFASSRAFFTLKLPSICCTSSSESDRTCSSRQPWRFAHSSAASRPRYSATLFVACPIASENSSTSVPSGCSMRTPKPAGPGLPRAPPSIYAITWFTVQGSLGGLRHGISRGCGNRRRNEVQDPVAAVALDDLIVPADVVEHLRPHAHVTDDADAVLRFGDRDAVAAVRDQFERREHLRRERFRHVGALGGELLERPCHVRGFGGQRLLLRVDFFLLGGQIRVRALHGRGQFVAFEHLLQDGVLGGFHLGLRER